MFSQVSFTENISDSFGGGMYNSSSNPVINSITFDSNSALERGGAIYNNLSSPSLANLTISGNIAPLGAGIYNSEHSNPTLTSVLFFGNQASQEGAAIYNSYSTPTLINSILWDSGPDEISGNTVTYASYSIIQGGYPGEAILHDDPLLGPLQDNGGFTLTHALLPGSPAIDTGFPGNCPLFDQRGYFRPLDGNGDGIPVCDMGPYEFSLSTPVLIYLSLIVK